MSFDDVPADVVLRKAASGVGVWMTPDESYAVIESLRLMGYTLTDDRNVDFVPEYEISPGAFMEPPTGATCKSCGRSMPEHTGHPPRCPEPDWCGCTTTNHSCGSPGTTP